MCWAGRYVRQHSYSIAYHHLNILLYGGMQIACRKFPFFRFFSTACRMFLSKQKEFYGRACLLLYLCPLRFVVSIRHRADRALGLFSSRPNWDPPTPSPTTECASPPPPLWFRGGGTHSLAGEGVGESQFGRGDTDTCVL